MSWFNGPGFVSDYGERGFESGPVRLNIDDVREIFDALRNAGLPSIDISGTGYADHSHTGRRIDDMATANLADIGRVKAWGELLADDGSTAARIDVLFEPDRVNVSGFGDPAHADALRSSVGRIRQVVANAARGPMAAHTKAALITRTSNALVIAALIGLWIWLVLDWSSWAGRALSLVLVAAALRTFHLRPDRFAKYLRNRRGRFWLDQKSQLELATERANSRRDRQVAIWVGGPVAVIAAAVGTAIGAWLS